MKHCLPYLGQGDLYSFCIYEAATLLADIEGVETNCTLAGKWEGGCRNAWVIQELKKGRYTKEDLLRACGEFQSCSFDVFDWYKAEKIVDQLIDSDTLDDKLGFHCREHALESWRRSGKATAEEVEGLMLQKDGPSHQEMRFLTSVIGCDKVGQCAGNDEVKVACERALAGLSRGDWSCR